MLNIDQSRESGFRRLLQSGNAKVAACLLVWSPTSFTRRRCCFKPIVHHRERVLVLYLMPVVSPSAGPAESLPVLVQGGLSPVCGLQPAEARRLPSGRVGGHLPRGQMLEAGVHRRLPHAGQSSVNGSDSYYRGYQNRKSFLCDVDAKVTLSLSRGNVKCVLHSPATGSNAAYGAVPPDRSSL